jgi:geranylgeranyl pyrophosphate synthase
MALVAEEPAVEWPPLDEFAAAVGERLDALISGRGEVFAEVAHLVMASEGRPLSAAPRPSPSLLVAAACASAGGLWRWALWPAAAIECAIAAADVFDDVADGETDALGRQLGDGVLITGASGLLALAAEAVLRVEEEWAPAGTGLALGRLLSDALGRAADGQARALRAAQARGDVVGAYQVAAGKSGPLGALTAQLGARCATDDAALLELYGAYGWHLAVHSQLMNDARDAAPGAAPHKRDVREGRRTVPLEFVGSPPAPPGLSGDALAEWEERQRQHVVARGGVAAALALAHAERLRALQTLDALAQLGRPVRLLRDLLSSESDTLGEASKREGTAR